MRQQGSWTQVQFFARGLLCCGCWRNNWSTRRARRRVNNWRIRVVISWLHCSSVVRMHQSWCFRDNTLHAFVSWIGRYWFAQVWIKELTTPKSFHRQIGNWWMNLFLAWHVCRIASIVHRCQQQWWWRWRRNRRGDSSQDDVLVVVNNYFGGKTFVWLSDVKFVLEITFMGEIIKLYERSRRKLRK